MITPISEYGKRRNAPVDRLASKTDQFRSDYRAPCVYVVSEDASRMVKIGHSTDLARRIASFETASPAIIRLEAAVYVADKRDAVEFERAVHAALERKGLRVKGEWFAASDTDLRDVIYRVLRTWDKPARTVGLASPVSEDLETEGERLAYTDEFMRYSHRGAHKPPPLSSY